MISVCMIVKNEIKVLERCINSIREKMSNVVGEIVVVDTGSVDGTKNLAEKLNCEVYDFEWCNDFSKARNYSISKAKYDWIFVIDADEYIVNEVDEMSVSQIYIRNLEEYFFLVSIESINDNGLVESNNKIGRIFKKTKYKFQNIIHEQLMPIGSEERKALEVGITLRHTGYMTEVINYKNKTEKYKNLLLTHIEQYPSDIIMYGHLGTMYMQEKNYEKALECLEKVTYSEESYNKQFYATMVCSHIQCLSVLGRYNEAAKLEDRWEYCEYDDKYLFHMADIFLKTNQIEKGVDTFLTIVNEEGERSIDKRFSYYALGEIFEKFNELEQALNCFQICDDFKDAKLKVEQIKSKM